MCKCAKYKSQPHPGLGEEDGTGCKYQILLPSGVLPCDCTVELNLPYFSWYRHWPGQILMHVPVRNSCLELPSTLSSVLFEVIASTKKKKNTRNSSPSTTHGPVQGPCIDLLSDAKRSDLDKILERRSRGAKWPMRYINSWRSRHQGHSNGLHPSPWVIMISQSWQAL